MLLEILVLSLLLRASGELPRTLEMLMFLVSLTVSDGILAIIACLRIQTFWWGQIGCTLGITVSWNMLWEMPATDMLTSTPLLSVQNATPVILKHLAVISSHPLELRVALKLLSFSSQSWQSLPCMQASQGGCLVLASVSFSSFCHPVTELTNTNDKLKLITLLNWINKACTRVKLVLLYLIKYYHKVS